MTNTAAKIEVRGGYFFEGTVSSSSEGTWTKGFFGAEKGGEEFLISWEERVDGDAGWYVYEGKVAQDGCSISGTFKWSMLPKRITGDFTFALVDPP